MHEITGRSRLRGRRLGPAAAAALALSLVHVTPAGADVIDELGKKLVQYEAEVQQLGAGIQKPSEIATRGADERASRLLIDAQVAFGTGDYDAASLMLYDFAEKYDNHRSYDEALYYLGESLFQKGDYVAARSYFRELVRDVGSRSKFYQQGLERLIELSLKLRDSSNIDEWLSAIESVPAGQRRSSVPYVQGKYAFFQEDHDQALDHFEEVPRDSDYYFQAQYFIGAAQVSTGNLAGALKTYDQLTETAPRGNDDERIIELAYMALGRLHYERDQASRAIDFYLQIDRRSDLFDEALYEVAWVYVKADQFDKALRALELLALADPTSQRLPEVRILEGNLRIRKAQRIAENTAADGNSTEEYAKAIEVFQKLEKTFRDSHDKLVELSERDETAEEFMAQITGRTPETFDVQSTLPPVAAGWIREEPEVERVVDIEVDLEQINNEIEQAEETISRLERALDTSSRVNIFPSLAEKKTRTTEILEDLFSIRQQLATHERALVRQYASQSQQAELDRLQARRQKIARELSEMPHAELAYGDRIQAARAEFDALDRRAAEVATVIDSTQATLVALQKYIEDQGEEVDQEALAKYEGDIETLEGEVEAMQAELEAIRTETVVGKDAAGTGDAAARRAKKLRDRLRQALDDEHRYMMGVIDQMSGNDRTKGQQIATLTRKANSITVQLDRINARIDDVVDFALSDVREELRDQKAKLSAYKREFELYEDESRQLGGIIIATSFRTVKEKFYDVLIRSDVGVIDVTWSQREAAERAARTLELDLNRELQTLHADFRDIIEEERAARREQEQNDAEEGAQ